MRLEIATNLTALAIPNVHELAQVRNASAQQIHALAERRHWLIRDETTVLCLSRDECLARADVESALDRSPAAYEDLVERHAFRRI